MDDIPQGLDKKLKEQLAKSPKLIHSTDKVVESHVQREKGDWVLNTLMLKGYDVAFKYKRKKQYVSLKGARVNLTYYPTTETVAGFEVEYMKVVRIRRA